MSKFRVVLITLSLSLGLVACASRQPAPVVDRLPPAAKAQGASAASKDERPDTYIVKRGDTLYSIALDQGLDWRELAARNNLIEPYRLSIGQSLRLKPAAGAPLASNAGVQVNPLASGPAIEARPLGTPGAAAEGNSQPPATAVAPPGTPGGNGAAAGGKLKTEPKALKLPYTEQNLALIQRTDAANAVKPDSAPPASPAVVAPVPAPAPGAAPVTPPKAEAKVDTPAAPDEGLDWMWPASGKLVSKYAEGGNKGVDIGGRIGEPVYAAAAGKVMYSGSGVRGYGNLVIIKHNEKYLSAYAHNKSILVKEGQSVKRGQKIAELGDSGTDSAKLHFEIRRFGKPIDPLQFLPDRPGG